MTLSDLRTLLDDLLKMDLDNVKADQTTGATAAASLSAQVNEAAMLLSKELWIYDPKVTWTGVASTKDYNLDSLTAFSKRLWRVSYVVVNEYPLYDCARTGYGLWSMDELDHTHPAWRTGSADTPRLAIQIGNKLLVYPSPTQAVIDAGNNYVAGYILQGALTHTTDDAKEFTDIPYHLHRAIGYLAASLASEPVASEGSAWTRIARYDQRMAAEIKELAYMNRNIASGNGTASWTRDRIRL